MEYGYGIPLLVVSVAATLAAVTDLWMLKIHNVLTFPLLLSGLCYHFTTGGAVGLAGSVLGVIVGSAPLLIPYARGGMGAGDLKLIAGIGAWLGAWYVLHVLIVAGLATGLFATGLVIWNRTLPPSESLAVQPTSDVSAVVITAQARRRVVPFGAMLAIGVAGTILWIGE